VIIFLAILVCLGLFIRYCTRPQTAERWSRRGAALVPLARHAKADAQAVAWHVRHWRSVRRFRKGL
jgi:hypothetical protein